MFHTHNLTVILLAGVLTACASSATPTNAEGATHVIDTPIVETVSVGTASVTTVEPVIITAIAPEQGTSVTYTAPTPTPIPPLPGGLRPTELKYRVLAQFPDFFFCDPDYYPVARADEMDLARQNFPDLQANPEEFNAILVHNDLTGVTTFSDDQILLVYREHKKLSRIFFEVTAGVYQFQIQVAKTEGNGELISGVIDGQGAITVQKREPTIATCPICLAAGTLIDIPEGSISVQSLSVGMLVWTIDKTGTRVALRVRQVGQTIVPSTHQVIHLTLSDGRDLWASPGHPTADGRELGDLKVGDFLEGALIVLVERVRYTDTVTYDLLPEGPTGFYWANGILLGSTLMAADQP
jgi:hypothetical protein